MYRGFSLLPEILDRISFVSNITDENAMHTDSMRQEIQKSLDKYLNIDLKLDGTIMQEDWFPTINADIFISHSHADEKLAIRLANWLYQTFELNVFIDSCVWGYSNDLLETIDDKYCKKWNGDYCYDMRNFSTSHVHMMLANALTKMINKTEVVLFLNTPKSLSVDDVVKKTASPWIYYELMTCKYIQKHIPERCMFRHVDDQIIKEAAEKDEANIFAIEYDVDLKDFTEISFNALIKWEEKSKGKVKEEVLDILYDMKPLDESIIYYKPILHNGNIPVRKHRVAGPGKGILY